jgi:hypothetical protein
MAEQTFKVGDKVRHAWFDTVEVAYGPYTDMRGHTRYMVRVASGGEQPTSPEMMTALPAFAVGDKAKMDGEREPVEILAGPYKNRYITWYTVKAEVGDTTAAEDNLTALPAPSLVPVGTRVRVDRAKHAEDQHGKIGVVTSNTEDFRTSVGDPHVYEVRVASGTFYVAELTPVDEPTDWSTFEYEGVTYDVTARYRDRDNDVWEFTGERHADGSPKVYFHGSGYDDLGDVVEAYGPLTKI